VGDRSIDRHDLDAEAIYEVVDQVPPLFSDRVDQGLGVGAGGDDQVVASLDGGFQVGDRPAVMSVGIVEQGDDDAGVEG